MKQIIICISLSFFFLFASGQKTVVQKHINEKSLAKNQLLYGEKNGKWIEYIDSTFLPTPKEAHTYYRLITYKNGLPIGLMRTYYANDTLRWIGKVISLVPELAYDSLCKSYYPTGELETEVYYTNAKKQGSAKEYYKNGKIKIENQYLNGARRAQYCYYENGNLKLKNEKQNGGENFVVTYFYNNGVVSLIMPWKNDSVKHGVVKSFYDTGQLLSEFLFVNGKFEKTSTTYTPDGFLIFEDNYFNGLRNGLSKAYYLNSNQVSTETQYINDLKEGFEWKYSENGYITSETPYHEDVIHGIQKIYYEKSAQLKLEIPYFKGKKNGILKLYNENGKVSAKVKYENDVVKK